MLDLRVGLFRQFLVRLRVGTHVQNQEPDPFLPFLYGFDVRPDARNEGLEEVMLGWACAQARAAEEGRGRRGSISISVPLKYPAIAAHRQPLLGRYGFAPAGASHFMVRSLHDPIPQPEFPTGFTFRPAAGEADIERQVELFTRSQRYPWTIEQHRDALADPDYRADLDLIGIAPDGQFVAYCKCDILQETCIQNGRRQGWVTELGTRPGFRDLWLERSMLLASLHALQRAGIDDAVHREEMENIGSSLFDLYEALGFRVADTTVFYRKEL